MPAILPTELRLIELFSSIQGEGLFLGRRQLFVRLAECNLNCAYCDTPFQPPPFWRVETSPGSGAFAQAANPVAAAELSERIRSIQQLSPIHHSLALTGGEPLMQVTALAAWLPQVNQVLPVFLETNGTLPQSLAAVLPWLAWVSMDIKLESSCGVATPWQAHADFIRLAGEKLCQVKLVIDPATPDEEVVTATRLVADCAPGTPLILQPRTIQGRPGVSGSRLLDLQEAAARIHAETLVIPQLHPLLAVP